MPRAYSSVICSAVGFANATFSYLEKASHRKIFIKKVNAVVLVWMGCKKTFAKAIAFCLNLCYNIHRKRAPMSVAPLISLFKK